jgi:predicted transcriptional regulator
LWSHLVDRILSAESEYEQTEAWAVLNALRNRSPKVCAEILMALGQNSAALIDQLQKMDDGSDIEEDDDACPT